MKTAGDFISQYIGGSQKNAVNILESAKGKVLVIDEAYNLHDNLYGSQVLDVIVEKVQGTESDDMAVILVGYEHQMKEMMRVCNPGLARRFALDYAFYFDDYEPDELLDLFLKACERQEVDSPLDVTEEVMRVLTKQRVMSNFGNAGAIDLILRNAVTKASSRLSGKVTDRLILKVEDVKADKGDEDDAIADPEDPLDLLDSLYRMDTIKHKLNSLRNRFTVAEREGNELPEIGHFVFRGSPGTGEIKYSTTS